MPRADRNMRVVDIFEDQPVPSELTERMRVMTEQRKRGFQLMSKERLHELAKIGGKAVHAQGKAKYWDSEGARKAAMKSLESRKLKGQVK